MKVLIPRPGCWFAPVYGNETILSGPFHDTGEPWQSINYPTADLTTFIQGTKIASESSVFHQKVDGNIFVVPQLSGSKSLGIGPHGLEMFKVNGYNRSGSRKFSKSITTSLALAITGQSSEYYTSPTSKNLVAIHSARVDPWLVQISRLTISNDSTKNRWHGPDRVFKFSRADDDNYWFSESNINWHEEQGPPTEPGGRAATRRRANETILVTFQAAKRREKFFLDDIGFSMSAVKSWINTLVNPRLFQNLPSLNNISWGDLIHEATGNLDANSANMIAFFRDLKDVKSLVPKLKELGRISTHANNYLAMEYGVLPTVSDLKTIWEAFSPKKFYDRSGYRRVSAYETIISSSTLLSQPVQVNHTRRIHVAVNDRDVGLDALSERIRSMGFFPSLTNIWDLVPYSFVLDWFVDVGSVFERIDTRHRLLNLDIPYVIKSDKIEVNLNSIDPKLGAGLDLVVSRYSRDVATDVPQPRIFGEISKPPTAQNHWVEGSALIVQRTKK